MKRVLTWLVATAACVFLFGCAHPITMNPDLAIVTAPAGTRVIDKKVAYSMSDASRLVEVTTPGGGGDKVRYFPYRDIEPGIYKALSEVFTSVTKVQSPADGAALKGNGVMLLIAPEISTTSSSSSAFTWPPTEFGVTLVCSIADAAGNPIKTVKVTGTGNATFDEFKANFSLAAVRASNDALSKLIKELLDTPELRK